MPYAVVVRSGARDVTVEPAGKHVGIVVRDERRAGDGERTSRSAPAPARRCADDAHRRSTRNATDEPVRAPVAVRRADRAASSVRRPCRWTSRGRSARSSTTLRYAHRASPPNPIHRRHRTGSVSAMPSACAWRMPSSIVPPRSTASRTTVAVEVNTPLTPRIPRKRKTPSHEREHRRAIHHGRLEPVESCVRFGERR